MRCLGGSAHSTARWDLGLPQAPGEAIFPLLEAGRAKPGLCCWRHLTLKAPGIIDFELMFHPGSIRS